MVINVLGSRMWVGWVCIWVMFLVSILFYVGRLGGKLKFRKDSLFFVMMVEVKLSDVVILICGVIFGSRCCMISCFELLLIICVVRMKLCFVSVMICVCIMWVRCIYEVSLMVVMISMKVFVCVFSFCVRGL